VGISGCVDYSIIISLFINNDYGSGVSVIAIVRKEYVLTDIMRKRKKDKLAVDNKIRSKLALKSKRTKSKDALKAPEKFIKQYRAQQKSYAHYRLKVPMPPSRTNNRSSSRPVETKDMHREWASCC
jgi:hypothetical protein